MYTQCPECSTAFRVTADVLRQAAGKVRCGGCGSAFNALEYLSESMPEQKPPRQPEEYLPELKPDSIAGTGLPKAISAEQSAALLKTLDELAGADIRIEDTGVEWRVLDDDEVGDAADDSMAIDVEMEDQPVIDEILEDSPTPIDQFLTSTPPQVDAPEIFAPEANAPMRTPVDELRFDDNTPLPDDFIFDDAPFDPAGAADEPRPAPAPTPLEKHQRDLELTEPDEWTDILDEFEDLVGELADDDVPLDVDSQFALQAEAMGIELSGTHRSPAADLEEQPDDDVGEDDIDALLAERSADDRDIEELLEEEIVEEVDDEAKAILAEILAEETDREEPGEESTQLELIDADDDFEILGDGSEDEDDDSVFGGYDIPPMTEEEKTINMQIDQDLLAIAVEDDEGFISTMVLPESAVVDKAVYDDGAAAEKGDDETDLADTGAGFETIIMEGEFVRSEVDADKLAADAAAAAALAGAAAAERADQQSAGAGGRHYGMVAGLVALALLLVGQIVHQSRNSLATIPAFNDTVGPLYRAIGQPLSPDWDITGWRFEATRGSTDETDQNLAIYSRLGNTSDKPLPYPLISVSLTDRFEETIGNRVLDPAEYLANDLDPRKLVAPGNTFNAVITIQSPSEEATGFKLNVCYRESGGNLRCAIDDFK